MKYQIFYRPVFHKRAKTLAGYEMVLRTDGNPSPEGDFDVLSIETESDKEFSRFDHMMKGTYDPFDDISFVDTHPLDILRFIRGEKEAEKARTTDWQKELGQWTLNARGERV